MVTTSNRPSRRLFFPSLNPVIPEAAPMNHTNRRERVCSRSPSLAAHLGVEPPVLNAFSQVADSLQALGNDADSLSAQQRALLSAGAVKLLLAAGGRVDGGAFAAK
jgi:hypothetical protein